MKCFCFNVDLKRPRVSLFFVCFNAHYSSIHFRTMTSILSILPLFGVLGKVTANPIHKQTVEASWNIPRQPVQTVDPFSEQSIRASWYLSGHPIQSSYPIPAHLIQSSYPFPEHPVKSPYPLFLWTVTPSSNSNPWKLPTIVPTISLKPLFPSPRRHRQAVANSTCGNLPACRRCLGRNYCKKWGTCQRAISKDVSTGKSVPAGWWVLCARDGKHMNSPVWVCASDASCTEYICTDVKTCFKTNQSGMGYEIGEKHEDDELTTEFYGSCKRVDDEEVVEGS